MEGDIKLEDYQNSRKDKEISGKMEVSIFILSSASPSPDQMHSKIIKIV